MSKSTHVVVKHGFVGQHPKDTILPVKDIPEQDFNRLLEMGAISFHDSDEPVGERPPTLTEANRSESPPTLPNAPYVDATAQEIRDYMKAPDDTPVFTARTQGNIPSRATKEERNKD